MINHNQQKQYVWIRESGTLTLIDDPVELWKDSRFNKETDRIHRLGEEVEIKVSVEVKNKTTRRDYDWAQKE